MQTSSVALFHLNLHKITSDTLQLRTIMNEFFHQVSWSFSVFCVITNNCFWNFGVVLVFRSQPNPLATDCFDLTQCSIYNHIQKFIQRLFGQSQRSQLEDSRDKRPTSGTQGPVSSLIMRIMIVTYVHGNVVSKSAVVWWIPFRVCVVACVLTVCSSYGQTFSMQGFGNIPLWILSFLWFLQLEERRKVHINWSLISFPITMDWWCFRPRVPIPKIGGKKRRKNRWGES